MIKRVLLASLALTLCLAVASPSQASTVVSGDFYFAPHPTGAAGTVKSITAAFTDGFGSISDVSVTLVGSSVPAGLSNPITFTSTSDSITISFASPGYKSAMFDFSFDTTASYTDASNGTAAVSVKMYSGSSTRGIEITSISIPEPTSVALMGIGFSGLIAFRRWFPKKSRVG